FGNPYRRMAQDLSDFALEVSHARLARVMGDDFRQCLVGDLDLISPQPIRLQLPAQEIASRDLELFLPGVTGEADDFHPIAQRTWDRIEHVGGGDEYHAAQIERHAEIIVAERIVLLRIEHFEKRGSRIAVNPGPELVDFIEHHHAIARASFADRLNYVSR